jgi:short-subunit dehydrogenase
MNTIITGASKGIGRASAEMFAKEGSNLALCARNINDLTDLKSYLLKLNPSINVYIESINVSDSKAIKAFGSNVLKEFGTVDVLINNAGVYTPGNVLEEEDGSLEHLIETNLYSAYNLTRIICPSMIQNKRGHIINLCSVASLIALPNGGSYSISKFALHGFTKVLREELKDKGVKVSAIMPGATWSASWEGVDLPDERLMKAADIAKVIFQCTQLSDAACIEDIVIRPQLGDL